MSYSLYEQEITISYNAAEDFAVVFAAYPPIKRKIEKLIEEYPDQIKIRHSTDDDITVEVPKKWIKIRPPREMSEEQKLQAKERMEKYWANK